MQSPQQYVRRSGFTLIELLVVVAIIALLISILLPSLQRARDQTRATLCAANMKHASDSAQMWFMELTGSGQPTNGGWAIGAFRMAGGETRIFNCPSDANPVGIPAFFVQMYRDGLNGRPYATASPDGPFNWLTCKNSKYILNIQDCIESRPCPGGDADSIDDSYMYQTNPGDHTVVVRQYTVESANDFTATDWKGRKIIDNAKARVGTAFTTPLLWDSFGLNAVAGCRNVKGNPIFLSEFYNSSKYSIGIFTERLCNYGPDNLKSCMRLRHGGRPPAEANLFDKYDKRYAARDRANCAFRDGHVERLSWAPLVRQLDPVGLVYPANTVPPGAYTALWRGSPIPRPLGWYPQW